MSQMYPLCQRLAVHMPGGEQVQYERDDADAGRAARRLRRRLPRTTRLLGDVLLHILQSLLLKELGRAAQVSKFWQSVADCDTLWGALCLRTPFYRLMGAMKETRPDIGYKALYVQRREFITFSNLFPSPAV